MTAKRKNKYKTAWEQKFNGIRQGKDEFHAHCIPCNDEIDVTSIGKTAISTHQNKAKHIASVKAAASTKALSNFMPNRSNPTPEDDQITAAEGSWAYHVVAHHHSFKSTDCVSTGSFFKTIFHDSRIAKKFSLSRIKATAIVKGIHYEML